MAVKLDERFMTILTALLVLVGVGAVLNSGEDGDSVFSGSGNFNPKSDSFTLRAGRLASLDVLLNDSNADRVDPAQLRIAAPPHCGVAEAMNGAIQYSDSGSCAGAVSFAYCVPFEGDCRETTVALTILKPEEETAPRPTDGSPVIVEVIQQGSAPQDQPTELAMRQPKRLSLPSTAEVITPQQAAEDIRRLGGETQAVVASDQSDSAVVVSNTSARSGSVATSGVNLAAPDPGEESVDLALADPAPATALPARPAAPQGLVVTSVESPRFESAPAISLSVPTPPADEPETEVATTTPEQTEVAIATPEPAATQPEAEVVTVPPTEPAPAQPETEVVAAPAPTEAPEAAETVVLAGTAPLAQSDQPAAPDRRGLDIPDSSGVLASLGRSNSFLGVTFSAAKALLSPNDVRAALVSPASTAPRPSGLDVIGALDNRAILQDAAAEQLPMSDRPIAQRAVATIQLASLTVEPSFIPRTAPAAPPPRVTEAAPTEAPATTEIAALTTEEPAPVVKPALRPSVDCGVDMVLQVRVGAEILATLSSPCRPNTPFEVDHAGLRFTGFTDIDGVADFLVPAMVTNATVAVAFGDGAYTVGQIDVENMSRMTRVAVVWDGDVNFDLNAYEFGADVDSIGHIRPGYARDYRSARRAGGGYLLQLGPGSGLGTRAEVYTIFESSRTEEGVIDLQLRLSGAGDSCAGTPALTVVRSDGAQLADPGRIDLSLDVCGGIAQVVQDNIAGDIDLAQR